jgi:hypothetical protein
MQNRIVDVRGEKVGAALQAGGPRSEPATAHHYNQNEVQRGEGLRPRPDAQKAHGHEDWHVPTKNELNVLFNNRAAIGGFDISGSDPSGWYWSSSSFNIWLAWGQRFSDGYQDYYNKYNPSSVRCVR